MAAPGASDSAATEPVETAEISSQENEAANPAKLQDDAATNDDVAAVELAADVAAELAAGKAAISAADDDIDAEEVGGGDVSMESITSEQVIFQGSQGIRQWMYCTSKGGS